MLRNHSSLPFPWIHLSLPADILLSTEPSSLPPPSTNVTLRQLLFTHFLLGLVMERTSEFLQACYYRYLGLYNIRHWHCKRSTSTWGILWYYGILYVFFLAFYHSNRRLTILLGCWILPQFQAERIVTEYLWVWLAGLFMIIIYGIMLAIIHRWFNIAHGIHWLNQPARDALDVESDDKKIKAVASNSIILSVYFHNWRLIFKSEPFYSFFPKTLFLVGSTSLKIRVTLPHTNLHFLPVLSTALSGVFNLIISFFSF